MVEVSKVALGKMGFGAGLLLAMSLVTGCGSHALASGPVNGSGNAAGSASVDKAAVSAFIQQENPAIQQINQSFANESKLFEEVSTKQMSYSEFQTDYAKDKLDANAKVNQLANAKAPAGAKKYQAAYVSLLQEGLKVFADQEQAILPNRTVDRAKAAKVQQELTTFVTQSQQLANKYGVK